MTDQDASTWSSRPISTSASPTTPRRCARQYHERFIPQAIDTGEHFFAEDPERPKFIWTTGAWLIWDHLEPQDRRSG